jgi:hypothetical protein
VSTSVTRPGPVALVTGASAGIGIELAHALAARGHAHLILTARREEKLREVAAELEDRYEVRAHVIPADLARDDGPDRVSAAVEDLGLPVDFLANNAGLGQWGPYLEQGGERESQMIHVNVHALTRLTRLLLPGMVERGRGHILNVASTAAFFPGPLMTVYYATKAYVLSYSVGLAEELRGTGVSVTCLCPGPTESEFTDHADMDASSLFSNSVVMDARPVAEAGVAAALDGEVIRTPGLMNKLNALSSRLFPRGFLARVVKRIQGPRGR